MFGKILVLVAVSQVVLARNAKPSLRLHPDAGLNATELITKHGYPLQSHDLQTEDGYILTAHRIPHGQQDDGVQNKEVVLLVHGLESSSACWVSVGEGSLGFLLADSGYDVWLANVRGNTWSRRHITLDPDADEEEFFSFSFHEIGVFDLPAIIDHVLETTGQDRLFYIGHSQGTSAFFAMAAEKPEYNDKIRLMQALAPIAFMGNLESPISHILADNLNQLNEIANSLNIYELLRHSEVYVELGNALCSEESEVQFVCEFVFDLLGGFNSNIDLDMMPVFLGDHPAGASTRAFIHYGQEINSQRFRQFDYGSDNDAKYGQDTPPEYDLSKIRAPVSLFYGDNDPLASVIDVENLGRQLVGLIGLRKIPGFTHLDFIFSQDAYNALNKDVLAEIQSITRR